MNPSKSFEMHSNTNEIIIKIEEVTGAGVNKIVFFQDLSYSNSKFDNNTNLSNKAS